MPVAAPIALQCLILYASFLTGAEALFRALEDQTQHVETVYIRHDGPSHISKRSTNESPDELHVSFHAQNQPIKLRLKRHEQDVALPVYTVTNGQAVERPIRDMPRLSFYHDASHGAAFIYTRNHNSSRPFDLDGSMFINGFEYIVTPDHLVTWVGVGGAAHALKRLNSRLSFGHDGIDTRDPYTRFASHQRTLQRRDRRLLREHYQGREAGEGANTRSRRRRRRQSSEADVHHIELSIVADYAVWKRFLEFTSGDEELAFKELKHYYLFMAVMMDIRYRSVTDVDPSLEIRVTPVSLIVTDIEEEAVWTEKYRVGRSFVQAINSLYSLREWVRRGTGVPRADHTMLFSGYDLLGGQSDSSTIGVAFIGTACTYNSVSVIEEYFTGTSGTVSAHELGHSLNAEHDANYLACSDRTANVMSTQAVFPTDAARVANPWRFSDCSVDAFGAFLNTAKCTRLRPESSIATSKTAGVYFNADKQCQLVMGPKSYFCRSVQARKGFDRMCRHLYCYLPEDPGYCGSIIASEFTVCGKGKWCKQGTCKPDPTAPEEISDSCPQGDEPGYRCGPDDCDAAKVKDIYCCQTCSRTNASHVSLSEKILQNIENETASETSASSTDFTNATSVNDTVDTGMNTTEMTSLEPNISTTIQSPRVSTSALLTTPVSAPPALINTTQSTPDSPDAAATAAVTASPEVTLFDIRNTGAVTLMSTPRNSDTPVTSSTAASSSTEGPASSTTITAASATATTAATTPEVLQTTATKPATPFPLIDINNTAVVTLGPRSDSSTDVPLAPQVTTPDSLSHTSSGTVSPGLTDHSRQTGRYTPQQDLAVYTSTDRPSQTTDKPSASPTPTADASVTAEIAKTSPPTTRTTRPGNGEDERNNTSTTDTERQAVVNTTLSPLLQTSSVSLLPNGTDVSPGHTSTGVARQTIATALPPQPTSLTSKAATASADTTAKTTTSTTTTTAAPTTTPCHSIYCLCLRCYHCYANVCNMFLPGGFYYNYIYG